MEPSTVPRKDLTKVNKRVKSTNRETKKKKSPLTTAVESILSPSHHNTMDLDMLLASLTDNASDTVPYKTMATTSAPPPPPPQPSTVQPSACQANNYYTYKTSSPSSLPAAKQWKPRLLIRQAYRLGDGNDIVIGLESTGDYKPSIYLVGETGSALLTIEDLLGLRSLMENRTICEYLTDKKSVFESVLLDTIAVSPARNGLLCVYNFHMKPNNIYNTELIGNEPMNVCHESSPPLFLHQTHWNALKGILDCVESYYSTCAECSRTVHYLIHRYTRYFTKHYRARALISKNTSAAGPTSLNSELTQIITADLPTILQYQLNETRIPMEPSQDGWYNPTPLRTAMIPWIDAEVRRYCASNILDSVLDTLTYVIKG